MTKTLKILIGIAVALILAGAVLALVTLASVGFDTEKLGTGKFETKTYTPEGDLSSLEISLRISDVTVRVATDGVLRVECYETEKQPHTVTLADGKLTVTATDQRKWYEKITIFSKSPKVTVYVPAGEYEALTLETDTGDVRFLGELFGDALEDPSVRLLFGEFGIKTDTGDVEMTGGTYRASVKIKTGTGDVSASAFKAAGDVGIRTNTGKVTVSDVTSAGFSVETNTGKVTVSDATCADLSVETDTGKVKLTNVNCAALTVETDTGSVTLTNVVGTGDAKIETDTGDVSFDRCDAANYRVRTSTGDVEGTIRTEKVFFASSRTGKTDVPHTRSGGDFDASSSTGDIEITIAE